MSDLPSNVVALSSHRPAVGPREVERFRSIGSIARDVVDRLREKAALRQERRNLKILDRVASLCDEIDTLLYRRGANGPALLIPRALFIAFEAAARLRQNETMKNVRVLRAAVRAPMTITESDPDPEPPQAA